MEDELEAWIMRGLKEFRKVKAWTVSNCIPHDPRMLTA